MAYSKKSLIINTITWGGLGLLTLMAAPVPTSTVQAASSATDTTSPITNLKTIDFHETNHHSQASIEQGTLGDQGQHTFTSSDINETGSTSSTHYLRMPYTITANQASAWLAFAKAEAAEDYKKTGRSQQIIQVADTVTSFTIGQAGFPRVDTIDVASYQKGMTQANYNTLKQLGVKAVIVKASEGNSYSNPYAATQLKYAKNAGLKVATYHYVHFATKTAAVAEANYYAAALTSNGVDKSAPVVADLEDSDVGGNVATNLTAFWSTLKAKGYTNQVLYTGKNYSWSNQAIGTVGKARTWVAQYPYTPSASNLWNPDYGAWQFSSVARIPGYNSSVDVSIDYLNLFSKTIVYDKVIAKEAVNLGGRIDQSARQDGFYSAPYYTDSMTITPNTNATAFDGQTVQILSKATTTRSSAAGNTFYQVRLVDGRTFWTDTRAVKVVPFFTPTNPVKTNYLAKIVQTNRSDGLYPDGPYNTKLSNIYPNTNAPKFAGDIVTVSAEATIPNGTFCEITLPDGRVEWLDKRGLTTDFYDKVTSTTKLDCVGVIDQTGRQDGLYSAPWFTDALTITENHNAKLFNGQVVTVLTEKTTSRNSALGNHFYEIQLPNGNRHWIDSRGIKLLNLNTVTATRSLSWVGRINQSGRQDGLYSAPWYTDALTVTENHNAKLFDQQLVEITAEKTTNRSAAAGNLFYQITLANGRSLWIDARGVTLIPLDAVRDQVQVSYTAVINQNSRKDGLYAHPYKSNLDSLTPNTLATAFNGRGVTVLEEGTTSQGTYAKVKLPDGTTKWIDKLALKPISYDTIVSEKSLSLSGTINQAGRSDGLYSAPYYTDAMSVLPNTNALQFNKQSIKILKEVTTTRSAATGNHFYLIQLSNGRQLWIDARGVKLNR
ncbi:GW dipeptide domain-containing protein [Lacticaseibacillus salsurivasis]|uniref:GW dipeptide domain-containing protein n=1 Tax=Lacticaseibacillus salsurivasis TaxID=3081441 RepID=UPI0030C75455